MKKIFVFAAALCLLCCSSLSRWSKEYENLIKSSPELMRVLTVDEPSDSLILRTECTELSTDEINSETFRTLGRKMLYTVKDPSQDGVGIAAPQVGISRRLIAVQRFDKQGEPFELYANPRIISRSGEVKEGPEGCLSVPGRSGLVKRNSRIELEYTSLYSLKDTTEVIEGFTAVIFQHECDHLEGILFTDYLR
ncbi:MAG: peptide deformylase [Bacteroidales bacterium]|nr:peptide deformylase [Bacteroidales bacterium]